MSCDSNGLKAMLCAVRSAVPRAVSRRALYAGMAAGGSGAVGAAAFILALRQSQEGSRRLAITRKRSLGRQKRPTTRPVRAPLPQLQARTRITPKSKLSGIERCAKCGSSAGSKKGSWYSINNKNYCQDCAPQAARLANIDLAAPPRSSRPAAGSPLTAAGRQIAAPQPLAGIPRRSPGYLPPEKRVPTRLTQSRVRLEVGKRSDGQPVYHVVEQGHVVLRADGRDTGLAITPAVHIGELKNGVQEVTEDTSQWMLTHIPSGRSLGNRAFSNVETAQQLAGILAQLDWTREANRISDRDVNRVNQTFHYFDKALQAEQKQRAGHPASSPSPVTAQASPIGQLVADPYGGVARVLDVSDNGNTLFLVDSLGKRYEAEAYEVRTPAENDFRLGRIAMPCNPAQQKSGCGECGKSGSAALPGEKWYRMDYKGFCPTCAPKHADREAYLMPDEISAEMEATE